jgi:hypothetical protein
MRNKTGRSCPADLPRRLTSPRLGHPPERVFRFSGRPLVEGDETRTMDGVRFALGIIGTS